MRVLFQIQSRECERAEWRPWTLTVPFSCRADCAAQVELLNKNEPYPTRSWMARREFRLVEVPAGCPRCIAGAIGDVCEWHRIREAQGVATSAPAPLILTVTSSIRPSPKVRHGNRQGYSAEAIAILRSHGKGDAE